MSLRVLIYVGFRVYAVYYGIQVIAYLPSIVQLAALEGPSSRVLLPFLLTVPTFAILAAILWFSAERLASIIIPRSELVIDKFDLSLENAFTLTFVFLGLYFVFSSLASFLQQLYYLVAVVAQLPQDAPERTKAVFNIYRPGITLIAGGASLLGAPWWARKLTQWSSRLPH
jgi:hypothetical protein